MVNLSAHGVLLHSEHGHAERGPEDGSDIFLSTRSLLPATLSAPVHTGRPSQRLHRETPFPVSRTGHERPGIPDPGICPHPLTPLRYLSRSEERTSELPSRGHLVC